MLESLRPPPHPDRAGLLNAIGKFFETPEAREKRKRLERIARLPNDYTKAKALERLEKDLEREKQEREREK